MSAKVLVVGAASGGHLYPGLALVDALERIWGIEAEFIVGGSNLENRILARRTVHEVTPASWRRVASVATSWRGVREIFDAIDPCAVVSLGGGPALIPGLSAWLRGVPLFLVEQNRVLGRAHKLLLRFSTRVFLSFAGTRGSKVLARRGIRLGTPLRPSFVPTPVPEGRPRLLILGGSQGARDINETMAAVLPELVKRGVDFRALHVSGPGKGSSENGCGLAAHYAQRGVDAEVVEYLEDPGPALEEASCVVARAGGSTIAEIAAVGRGALLSPYPHHRDRQQFHNAEPLVAAGAAQILDAALADKTPWVDALALLLPDRERLVAMGASARRIGRPGSAPRIAEVIASHLDRVPLRWGVSLPALGGRP